MSALSRFQDDFARALRSPDAPGERDVAELASQPAFAVYRNTVMKGCIDALQANFPAVTRLVGEEWLRAAAAVYATRTLPSERSLLAYGESFPDFLAGFEPAAELPYLPDVARLERFWTQSHTAADEPVLDMASLTGLDPESMASAVLRPHPAARWAWFPEAPIFTIWSRNREDGEFDGEIDWRGEGALLVRPHSSVRWQAIDAAAVAFLDACRRGQTVADAFDAALQVDGGANLAQLAATLIEAGAFGRLALPDNPDSSRSRS